MKPKSISEQERQRPEFLDMVFVKRTGNAIGWVDNSADARAWRAANQIPETAYEKFKVGQPGPTGEYPAGKLRPDDEGGINVVARIDRARGVIFLDFTKPLRWLALPPQDARRVAGQLIAMAEQLEAKQAARPEEQKKP